MAELTAPRVRPKGRRRKLWLGLIAGGAAVIVGVGGWQVANLLTATCGGGTSSYQGECVGATDGSYVFDPTVAAIEATVKSQNARAQATGDYVSIALLAPLISAPGTDVTRERVRQVIEGAATAQAYLNTKGYRPAIRLLLANEGSRQQAWPLPPLVPPSLSGRINGLVRVEPSVGDEVTLMWQYYRAHLGALSPRAVLVYDNDPNDLYTGSLSLDFSQQFGTHIIDKKQFSPGGSESGEFASIANDVCAPGAPSTPVVLYAGRESAFPDFIDKLRTLTNCPGSATITVLTGADAGSLSPSITGRNPDGPAIDVVYPNIADSKQLAPAYRQAFKGAPADVGASWAIMTYDAVTAAEQAARQAGQGSSIPPTPGAVTSLLYDFNKPADAIKGATGSFVITPDGDEGCQWIPLIIDEKGTSAILSQTRFGCPG